MEKTMPLGVLAFMNDHYSLTFRAIFRPVFARTYCTERDRITNVCLFKFLSNWSRDLTNGLRLDNVHCTLDNIHMTISKYSLS